MQLYTQYIYEKIWTKTNEKDALHIITEELGDHDSKGTLKYIFEEISKSKIITVGECRFKIENS